MARVLCTGIEVLLVPFLLREQVHKIVDKEMQRSHEHYLLLWQETDWEYNSKYIMGCFAEVHSYEILKMFCWTNILFMIFPFHSMSSDLSMPCLLHHVSVQSLRTSFIVNLTFSHELLLVSLHLGPLVDNFLNLLFPMICKSFVGGLCL